MSDISRLSSKKLAEIARMTTRQVQRILDRATPDLGATRTPGGHWIIPDTPEVRRWAKNHEKWKGDVVGITLKDQIKALQHELAEAREQRDRLAEVIKASTVLIAAKGRHNTMLAYDGLRDALAAVEGGSDD
jgi:hypothetical protein